MARGAILKCDEVYSLWEWLPATIVSRQDAAPTGKKFNYYTNTFLLPLLIMGE